MRKLLLSAVVVSLALGLAGCDDAKNKETNTPSAAKNDAPKEGGSLRKVRISRSFLPKLTR